MKKILKKIIRNLFSVHKIPKKIYSKIKSYNRFKRYDEDQFILKQDDSFSSLGLNRSYGLKKLIEIKKEYPFIQQEMSSEHQTLFASLSISKSFKNILEIGTYDGTNAFLLSKLFPNSNILTIDLDDEDNNFVNSYDRNESVADFCKKRDKILNKSRNIYFKKTNSLKLIFNNDKFDLIWIDGAHGYPVVTSDIVNSIRLLNSGGIIMCDDVWKSTPNNQDSMYSSIASFETLTSLSEAKIINFKLVYKRLSRIHNYIKENIKYIGFIKLQSRD